MSAYRTEPLKHKPILGLLPSFMPVRSEGKEQRRESNEHTCTNPNHKTNKLKPKHRRPRKSVIPTWEEMVQPSQGKPTLLPQASTKANAFNQATQRAARRATSREPRLQGKWDCTGFHPGWRNTADGVKYYAAQNQ